MATRGNEANKGIIALTLFFNKIKSSTIPIRAINKIVERTPRILIRSTEIKWLKKVFRAITTIIPATNPEIVTRPPISATLGWPGLCRSFPTILDFSSWGITLGNMKKGTPKEIRNIRNATPFLLSFQKLKYILF